MKMMKKAGFTLVELIVVITILAILGTIAFISLQGNTQDAKNSKVTSDLRTLVSAIEIEVTKGDITLSDIHATNATRVTNNTVATQTAFSGVTLTGGINYNIGDVDFVTLKQNGADFKDTNATPRDYIYSFATNSGDAYYQLAGEVKEASGNVVAYTKGNYVQIATGSDAESLIGAVTDNDTSDNDATTAIDVTGKDDLGLNGSLY